MDCLHLQHAQRFSFGPENLSQRIVGESDFSSTGYWYHRFQREPESSSPQSWYLCLSKGRVVFSARHLPTANSLLSVAERYIPRLRNSKTKQLTESLQYKLISSELNQPAEMLPALLNKLYHLNIVNSNEIERAIRLQILQDFDEMLFEHRGQAEFQPDLDLFDQFPIDGFNLQELVSEAQIRRLVWSKIKIVVPSLDSPMTINTEAMASAKLAPRHEQHLKRLMSYGETVNTISTALGQDTLEIAKGLAQLVNQGLLTIPTMARQGDEVWIIDDSLQMLHQFEKLVSSWGYKVRSHSSPAQALEAMGNSNPTVIFLDINMPGLSGFDLLKQIRRHPRLADVPLIMLTAEKTLSNNWRAQWSGCEFLSKPLAIDEVSSFKKNLHNLLKSKAL